MYAGERFNSISHLIGAILALSGSSVLITVSAFTGSTLEIAVNLSANCRYLYAICAACNPGHARMVDTGCGLGTSNSRYHSGNATNSRTPYRVHCDLSLNGLVLRIRDG